MFERYKFSLRQVWNICSKPDATLRYETLLNAFYGKNILKQYIMPQAEMLLCVVFITTLLYSEFNLASAVVSAIFNCFSFVVSYGVSCFLVRWVSLRWFVKQFDVRNVSIMVASLMSVTFVVNLFTALMPNMFFLKLFYVYMFFFCLIYFFNPLQKKNKILKIHFLVIQNACNDVKNNANDCKKYY